MKCLLHTRPRVRHLETYFSSDNDLVNQSAGCFLEGVWLGKEGRADGEEPHSAHRIHSKLESN